MNQYPYYYLPLQYTFSNMIAQMMGVLFFALCGAVLVKAATSHHSASPGVIVLPRLPEEARGDVLFYEYIRDLAKLRREPISEEEAKLLWEDWKEAQGESSSHLPPTLFTFTEIKRGDAERQEKLRRELEGKADEIVRRIGAEIRSYQPMGRMTEIAEVLGLPPRRGVPVSTPLGTYVFAKARVPAKETTERWFDEYERAEEMRKKAVGFLFFVSEPHRTIGNIKVLEHGKELAAEGLLDEQELAFVRALEEFWSRYPDADTGIVRPDGTIEPIYRGKK